MNILVLIRELDQTPLEREVRNGVAHGDILTFYNETDNEYNLMIDGIEYSNVLQVCLIFKEHSFYIYIQQGGNPNLIKLNIDNIEEINYFLSN